MWNLSKIVAAVSLENVITDIADMEKGMEMTKREYEARKDRDPPLILKDFLANSEDKIKKLKTDAKSAQVRYQMWQQVIWVTAKFVSSSGHSIMTFVELRNQLLYHVDSVKLYLTGVVKVLYLFHIKIY